MPSIHEEVYRPFRGTLRPHPLRFWPLIAANVRVATKKKLPLLLIYLVPTIATVIGAFTVYLKYAAEANSLPGSVSVGGIVELLAGRALKQLAVRNQIATFAREMQAFALIPAAWFGAGLIAEDLRVGAQQLYFSRPLTRLDYFLAKFLTAAFFIGIAVWIPPMVMCFVASIASEDWSFFRQEGDIIWRASLYSGIWVTVTSSLVLCASALAPRKIFALLGFFGGLMLLQATSVVLGRLLDNDNLFALGVLSNLSAIGNALFEQDRPFPPIPIGLAGGVLAGVTCVALFVIARRIRRLEVVS